MKLSRTNERKHILMNMTGLVKKILKSGAASARFKYSMIITAIGTVHVFLVVLFCILRVVPLVLLNIGSVLLYTSCLWAIRRDKDLRKVFYATYLEIIIQSFAATICIGWRFGFPQYVIALVPFGYYMCNALLDSRRRYVIATLLGLVAIASFISCRLLSVYWGEIYQVDIADWCVQGIYIFNALCNFGFLFLVTVVFLMEVQTAANQLQMQNAILDQMASTDPLTGLYNRRSMHVFLDNAVEAEGKDPFCLIMCDIDDFKKINDTYGHDAGDTVLKEIARLVQEQIDAGGYACRWGGEELLLIVHGDMEQACRIAEGIRCKVADAVFCQGGQSIRCTITIGVAPYQKGNTIDQTITHADNNLYYGKRNGKNRVVADEP